MTIYACPEHNRQAVLDAIRAAGFEVGWGMVPEEQHLSLRQTYSDTEAALGVESELGPTLEELGATYAIQQDAKYEFDGVVRMYAPDLGVFEGIGSQDGRVLVEAELVDDVAQRVLRVERALNRLTGKDWRDRLRDLGAQ